jgi:ABC-2 type transport system ATP-binding protein
MIEINSLSKVFKNEKKVLYDLTLRIELGSVHVLVGKNGSGKTTLLRIIAGLSGYTSGSVVVKNEKNKIVYLSTIENTGYPFFTSEEYFSMFLQLYGVKKTDVVQKLASIESENPNFSSILNTPYHECSAGMKQAIRLISAINVDASMYLLDEPLRSLDPEMSDYFIRKLESISGKQLVLLTAHQLVDSKSNLFLNHQLEGGCIV